MEDELNEISHSQRRNVASNVGTLEYDDIDLIFKGSQFGQRMHAKNHEISQSNSSDDSTDKDYDPSKDSQSLSLEFDTLSNVSSEMQNELDEILNISSDTELTFLDDVLTKLKQLKNNHKWSEMSTSDLVKNYLLGEDKAMKLFYDKMDILGDLRCTKNQPIKRQSSQAHM